MYLLLFLKIYMLLIVSICSECKMLTLNDNLIIVTLI